MSSKFCMFFDKVNKKLKISKIHKSSRIQRSSLYNSSEYLSRSLLKFITELLITNFLRNHRHLFQKLIEPPKSTNNASLICFSNLTNVSKSVSRTPLECNFNKMLLNTIQILILNKI